MPKTSRQDWDARHAHRGQDSLSHGPRALLKEHVHLLPKHGLALDAAAGVIQNGLFLARWGLRVLALDISEVGLRQGLAQARQGQLPVQAAVYDLRNLWLPTGHFDVITNLLFLQRETLPVYKRALKSGGLLFFEGFLATRPEHRSKSHYLLPGELAHTFSNFEILHHGTRRITRRSEEHDRQTEQLVVRKS